MELASTLFDLINSPIKAGLASLHITPASYAFLFPPGIDHDQIQNMVDRGVFPTVEGLAPAFTYFIILNLTRYFLTVFIFEPLARISMQIKEVPIKKDKVIDADFKNPDIFVDTKTIKAYCAKTGKDVNEVRRYIWLRKKNAAIKRRIVKFVEAFWRFLFYGAFVVFGYRALFIPETASWVKASINYYVDWPFHDVSPAIMLYYQVQLGSYFHQLLWTEVDRSDAWEMIAHHCITSTLLIASYLINYTRIGSIILFIHDLSDVPLELAKILNYTSQPKSNNWIKPYVDGIFASFMVTFFITRLVIYPKRVMHSLLTEGWEIYGCDWAGCYFFLGLLGSLQCLHVFWFSIIARMTYRLLMVGEVEKDVREKDEEHMDDDPALSDGESESDATSSSTASTTTSTSKVSNEVKGEGEGARRRKN